MHSVLLGITERTNPFSTMGIATGGNAALAMTRKSGAIVGVDALGDPEIFLTSTGKNI